MIKNAHLSVQLRRAKKNPRINLSKSRDANFNELHQHLFSIGTSDPNPKKITKQEANSLQQFIEFFHVFHK